MRSFSSLLYKSRIYPHLLRDHILRVFNRDGVTISLYAFHYRSIALCIPVRLYNTGNPSLTSHTEITTGSSDSSSNNTMGTSTGINSTDVINDGNSSSSSSSYYSHGLHSNLRQVLRTVRLHNMPKTWMHEEVVEFLHQVAEHAGIEPPTLSSCSQEREKENENNEKGRKEQNEEEEEDTTSAVPYVTSPFVNRMHIPFGRRTGIICGGPIIQLTSNDLAHYLLHELTFDPDDYRNRIYFTEVVNVNKQDNNNNNNNTMMMSSAVSLSEKEAMEAEQQEALGTLELDRYLLAPDLLYDIARMRQRRLVTKSSKLLLETFADDDGKKEEAEREGEEQLMESVENSQKKKKAKKNKKKRKTLRRVGECKEMGRGSMHSIPLAVPYVQGRRGIS
ncbi:hypothetical protein LSM04_006945 [Trypanosoma melophagium]|uniref:uncharacterized protein n=1 Tax=Trypanosoma melophagium TaxID=715481 RepID=UPI00351A870C|nr:hypothetical protein LSM04_006945 [Trypanosoma melophagium]